MTQQIEGTQKQKRKIQLDPTPPPYPAHVCTKRALFGEAIDIQSLGSTKEWKKYFHSLALWEGQDILYQRISDVGKRIEEEITIKWRNITYPVWVNEEMNSWCPMFMGESQECGDTKSESSKDQNVSKNASTNNEQPENNYSGNHGDVNTSVVVRETLITGHTDRHGIALGNPNMEEDLDRSQVPVTPPPTLAASEIVRGAQVLGSGPHHQSASQNGPAPIKLTGPVPNDIVGSKSSNIDGPNTNNGPKLRVRHNPGVVPDLNMPSASLPTSSSQSSRQKRIGILKQKVERKHGKESIGSIRFKDRLWCSLPTQHHSDTSTYNSVSFNSSQGLGLLNSSQVGGGVIEEDEIIKEIPDLMGMDLINAYNEGKEEVEDTVWVADCLGDKRKD
ncbi:hypothetical protein L1987_06448 [Smallanthus sonchifolius]|uniref:Uncharacterized protein n=1 Tax=Smallanthus sonchifolius TaxID=185202 RepID=A0ACB9JYJ6_9ASTR|nr:hypothetical protein L1987_06448 [Smallanthus sonchifolius]